MNQWTIQLCEQTSLLMTTTGHYLGNLTASLTHDASLATLSTTTLTSFTLIAAAEMGDKSQLVCMTLATQHRAWPVLLGSIAAFACLNSLAVIFGVVIAHWIPEFVIAAGVALLFAIFGIQSLRVEADADTETITEKSGHSLFMTAFLMIALSEFGDKTQLAVVALSSTAVPMAVWLGSTLALATTAALGVWAGRTLLQRIPLNWLHRGSGGIFMVLSVLAAWRSYQHFDWSQLQALFN